MTDRLTLHYSLQDIADYFRECFKNASPGSSAQVRFDHYIAAAEEADRLLKEQGDMGDWRPDDDGTGNCPRN